MNTLQWAWNGAKYYSQTAYYPALVYGRLRGMVQPYLSTEFNIHHIEDGVFIGDISSACNEEKLQSLGITHILTAILGVAPQYPATFIYKNVPIRDIESEDIKSHLAECIEFIDSAVASGGKILVHCVCGVSRSATIVAAWVMTKHGYSVEETIQKLKDCRECVEPNPAFKKQLELFANETKD